MHFLYASDEGFSTVLKASLHSLLEAHAESEITVHIIGENLSSTTINSIEALVDRFGKVVDFVAMPDFTMLLGRDVDTRRFTLSALSRLFVDSLIDVAVDRIIYLDCDTIVKISLDRLWNFDLQGAVIGAVNDCRNWRYLAHLGLSRRDVYINSGVLLIDLVRFRAESWQDRFRHAIVTYDGLLEFPDNDLICMLMQERLAVLPPEFNVISPVRMCSFAEVMTLRRPTVYYDRRDVEQARTAPAILHYTTFFGVRGRPWHEGYDDQDGALFRQHLSATGGSLRPAVKLSLLKQWSVRALKSPVRPLALFVFGFAHSVAKPSMSLATRTRIRAAQKG